MENKIKERTAELQHLNNTKDKFFSIISHDLRGPVTSFQSLARLFSYYNQEGQSDKIEELCSKVEQSVDTLNHLLENLLDWSLSHTNGIQCSFETIPLREFIQTIADIYLPNITAKEIEFSLDINDGICIRGDRHTLATVFRNLISNAIKFTPRSGSIRILAAVEDEKVRIELRDTGVGMDCRRLLNAFQLQGQRSTFGTEKEKGTGLGLVLVKEFTELNEGTITIQSDPGTGTLITLLLPRERQPISFSYLVFV